MRCNHTVIHHLWNHWTLQKYYRLFFFCKWCSGKDNKCNFKSAQNWLCVLTLKILQVGHMRGCVFLVMIATVQSCFCSDFCLAKASVKQELLPTVSSLFSQDGCFAGRPRGTAIYGCRTSAENGALTPLNTFKMNWNTDSWSWIRTNPHSHTSEYRGGFLMIAKR